MSSLPIEECPICWRSYSATLIPVTIVCGHSYCSDCSENLKKCTVCRRRLSHGYERATNYSLLSLVERLGTAARKETKDQQVQTDCAPKSFRRRNTQETQSQANIVPGDRQARSRSKQIVIKFNERDADLFRRMELKFK